jgi:hypothetical protein
MRWPRCGLAIAAPILLLTTTQGAYAAFQGPGQNRSEYLDVSPSDNVSDGQTVMVAGKGFKPNLALAFNMCLLVVRGYSDCDPDTTKLNSAKTDSSGSFQPIPFKLTRTVKIPSRKNVPLDCGTSQCSVGVGDPGGITGGSHCIGFGGHCNPAAGTHDEGSSSSLLSFDNPLGLMAVGGGVLVALLVILGVVGIVVARRRTRASG